MVLVGNCECNTERGFKNQLYIELGMARFQINVILGNDMCTQTMQRSCVFKFSIMAKIITYLYSCNKGPSIIDVNSEGEGGGFHTSKRKVDYLAWIGGPWGVKNLGNESMSIMDGP